MSVARGLTSTLILGAALFYGMAESNTATITRSTIDCSKFNCTQRNLRISKFGFFKSRSEMITLCDNGVNMSRQMMSDAETFFNQNCPSKEAKYVYDKKIIENACLNQWRITAVQVTYSCLTATTTSQSRYTATTITVTRVTSFFTDNVTAQLSNYTPMYSPTISTDDYQDIDSGNTMLTAIEDFVLTTGIIANSSRDEKLSSSLSTTNTGGDAIIAAVCTSAGCLAIVLVAVYSWRRKLWKKCLPRLRGHDREALSPHHVETDATIAESGDCSYENCQTSQLEQSRNVPKVANSHGSPASQVEKCANKFVKRNFEDVYYNVESLRTDTTPDSVSHESRDASTTVSQAQDTKEKENYENSFGSKSRDSTYFVLEQVSVEPLTGSSSQAIWPTNITIQAETELKDTATSRSFDFKHSNSHASFQAKDLVNAENDLYVSYADL